MGWLSSVKSAIRKVVGHRIIDEVNRTGRNIAPLAQPLFTAAGAIIGGAGGATAGAQIGGLAGKALRGKSLKDGDTPEVTVTFVLVDPAGNPILDPEGNYITESDLQAAAARGAGLQTQAPPPDPAAAPAPAGVTATVSPWWVGLLDWIFGYAAPGAAAGVPASPAGVTGSMPAAPAAGEPAPARIRASDVEEVPYRRVDAGYTGTITFGGRAVATYQPPAGTVLVGPDGREYQAP